MTILRLPDGREYDLADESQAVALGQLAAGLERRLTESLQNTAKLEEMLRAAISRIETVAPPSPTAAPVDLAPLANSIREMRIALDSGVNRIVSAVLADTTFQFDPVTGDPNGAQKRVR